MTALQGPMARILDLVDPPRFLAHVHERLTRFSADATWGDRARHPTHYAQSREAFAQTVEAQSQRRLADGPRARLPWRAKEPTPHTAPTVEAIAAEREIVALEVQNYRAAEHTSAQWHATLAPAADAALAQWTALAETQWNADCWLQATVSRCASWLLGAPGPMVSARDASDPRPASILAQPELAIRAMPLRPRHWHAWELAKSGLSRLPTLIVLALDESAIVRARAYRSLGQVGHCAVVPLLRDALEDPQVFARAQAARSLGWIADPGAVAALVNLARRDPEPEVQRSARVALARIVAYWEHYGEWDAVLTSPARIRALAQRLRAAGAFGDVALPLRDPPSFGRPTERIEGFRYAYDLWLDDDVEVTRSLSREAREQLPERFAQASQRKDPRTLATLCLLASRSGTRDAHEALEALRAHPLPALRWSARRALAVLRATQSVGG
ncbi:MAG: HEAT repeat domain-containing protein [Deltaproteobacteria bacterium]|nr:HEAT repeat domain-containing protein [Deltaproteobacteria bacterium]